MMPKALTTYLCLLIPGAYTQEFNSIVERTLGTLLALVRTNMLGSNLPERAYGECFIAVCYVLDRLPHKVGGKLSRLEKWKGRLLPDQRKRLRAWGSGCYFHLDHGARGHIGGSGRAPKNPAAAKGELGCLVGYEEHGLGYRVWVPGTFKIIVTPHVHFPSTPFFPCLATPSRELGDISLF